MPTGVLIPVVRMGLRGAHFHIAPRRNVTPFLSATIVGSAHIAHNNETQEDSQQYRLLERSWCLAVTDHRRIPLPDLQKSFS
jgi:hypothetical protein